MQHTVTVDHRTICYELERKGVKNINLRVRSDGSACVGKQPRAACGH